MERIDVELDPSTAETVKKLAKWSGHTPETVMEVLFVLALLREGLIK